MVFPGVFLQSVVDLLEFFTVRVHNTQSRKMGVEMGVIRISLSVVETASAIKSTSALKVANMYFKLSVDKARTRLQHAALSYNAKNRFLLYMKDAYESRNFMSSRVSSKGQDPRNKKIKARVQYYLMINSIKNCMRVWAYGDLRQRSPYPHAVFS